MPKRQMRWFTSRLRAAMTTGEPRLPPVPSRFQPCWSRVQTAGMTLRRIRPGYGERTARTLARRSGPRRELDWQPPSAFQWRGSDQRNRRQNQHGLRGERCVLLEELPDVRRSRPRDMTRGSPARQPTVRSLSAQDSGRSDESGSEPSGLQNVNTGRVRHPPECSGTAGEAPAPREGRVLPTRPGPVPPNRSEAA